MSFHDAYEAGAQRHVPPEPPGRARQDEEAVQNAEIVAYLARVTDTLELIVTAMEKLADNVDLTAKSIAKLAALQEKR